MTAAWAFDKAEVRDVALALIFLSGILATLFCRWWWRQIEDYKALNGSKFDVLAQMAKNIVLTGEETRRCAFDPFYWEWKLAEANKDLEGWNVRAWRDRGAIALPAKLMATLGMSLGLLILALTGANLLWLGIAGGVLALCALFIWTRPG